MSLRSAAKGRDLLNRNPLDLIEGDVIAGAVVELGGARAFVRRHELGVFQRAAGFEVGGDAGGLPIASEGLRSGSAPLRTDSRAVVVWEAAEPGGGSVGAAPSDQPEIAVLPGGKVRRGGSF